MFCLDVSILSSLKFTIDCVEDIIKPLLVSIFSTAMAISLFWTLKELSELPENAFQISLQPDWQIDNDFVNRPILARSQILVLQFTSSKGDLQ